MITIVEHGNMKRYPQHCEDCGCIFEVHKEDASQRLSFGKMIVEWIVKCPECGRYIKCENIGE